MTQERAKCCCDRTTALCLYRLYAKFAGVVPVNETEFAASLQKIFPTGKTLSCPTSSIELDMSDVEGFLEDFNKNRSANEALLSQHRAQLIGDRSLPKRPRLDDALILPSEEPQQMEVDRV